MTLDLKALAATLGGEVRGNHVLAPGPGHSSEDRSLSIKEDPSAPDGFIVNSFAGDDFQEARDHVKAHIGGGFTPPPRESRQPADSWRPVTPAPEDAPELPAALIERVCPDGHRFTGRWEYRDAAGRLHFVVVRFDGAAGKQICPFSFCRGPGGAREWRCKGVEDGRILYGLGRLAARPDAPVLVVEGERTADRAAEQLAEYGYVVVTSSGGSRAAVKTDWSPLAGRHVTIWPDADDPGMRYADDVANMAHRAGAASVRVVRLPAGLPEGWDLADDLPEGVEWADIEAALADATDVPVREAAASGHATPEDGRPLPLFPPLPAPEPYPMDALGPLAAPARAIASKVQVPAAIAAQSVLAAASLAVQAHCDVQMPYGQTRPLSCFFVTVAGSGDRKTSADNEALWPVYRHEKNLREKHREEMETWRIAHAAWTAEKKAAESRKAGGLDERRQMLREIGPEPERPLAPFIVTGDMTAEGLLKIWANAHAALGVFTAEGGTFTGGHGLSDENWLRTAASLSDAWDGKPLKRLRALDGVTILPGRRLALHVMVQPHAAGTFLADATLRDQGLLSRILVAAPDSIAGARLYRDVAPEDDATIRAYGAWMLSILERAPALAPGTRNEMDPRVLPLSEAAAARWRAFFDHVERATGDASGLRPIQDFASKAAEHAARLAGVLTAYSDLDAREIGADAMECAIGLTNFYIGEALRLHAAGRTDPNLILAQKVLDWMRDEGATREPMAFRHILRHGPAPARTKGALDKTISILTAHGWVREVSSRPRMLLAVEG